MKKNGKLNEGEIFKTLARPEAVRLAKKRWDEGDKSAQEIADELNALGYKSLRTGKEITHGAAHAMAVRGKEDPYKKASMSRRLSQGSLNKNALELILELKSVGSDQKLKILAELVRR